MDIYKVVSKQNNYYLVDGFTNEIYQLESLEDLEQVSKDDLSDCKEYQKLIPDNYQDKIKHNAKTLILEITQQCNLRCSYCVFDEDYQSERTHSSQSMSIDTAYDAINNFGTRITDEAYIIFYGGEPLLQFEFIKDIVQYSKKNIGNFVKFSFTTNAIYLTKEKIDFFKQNDFLITVSLDGDEITHNKYRKDKNGHNTFETIIKNLSYIYSNYREYYNKNIKITSVISDTENLDKINQYFSSNNLIKNQNIRFSNQIQKASIISKYMSKKFTKEYILNLIQKYTLKKSPIENNYYGDLLKRIKYRTLGKEAKKNKVKCIPFSNRTYIRTDGKVQFCERIENMGITQLSTNNMINTASSFLKEYQVFIEEKCNKCFAYNYCEMCFASFIENGNLNRKIADYKCEKFKEEIQIAFEIYIELMETNPKLLEEI